MQIDQPDSDGCTITVGTVTVVICNAYTYIYKTKELTTDSVAASSTMIKIDTQATQPNKCPRVSLETQYPGAVTYLADNQVYRAYIDVTTQNLRNDVIFSIDRGQFSGDEIQDVMVAESFTIILLANNKNFLAFAKPKIQGQVAFMKTGNTQIQSVGTSTIPLTYTFSDAAMQSLNLYVSPNSISKDNTIQKYLITQSMINGTLNDVVITKLPVEINVKTNEVTTITASFNFVAYGCEKCNTFAGQTLTNNFCKNFDPTTLPDYYEVINGGTGNNGNTSTGGNTGNNGSTGNNGTNGGGVVVGGNISKLYQQIYCVFKFILNCSYFYYNELGNYNLLYNNIFCIDNINRYYLYNSTSSSDSESGFGTGAIAGVAVGIVVIVLIGLAIGGWFYYKKHKQRKDEDDVIKKRTEKKQKDEAVKRKNPKDIGKTALQKKIENEQAQAYDAVKSTERDAGSNTISNLQVTNINKNDLEDIHLEIDANFRGNSNQNDDMMDSLDSQNDGPSDTNSEPSDRRHQGFVNQQKTVQGQSTTGNLKMSGYGSAAQQNGVVQPFSSNKYGSNSKNQKGYDPDLESGNLKQSVGFFSNTGGSANKNKLTASQMAKQADPNKSSLALNNIVNNNPVQANNQRMMAIAPNNQQEKKRQDSEISASVDDMDMDDDDDFSSDSDDS